MLDLTSKLDYAPKAERYALLEVSLFEETER